MLQRLKVLKDVLSPKGLAIALGSVLDRVSSPITRRVYTWRSMSFSSGTAWSRAPASARLQ